MSEIPDIDTSAQVFPVVYKWQVSSDGGITSTDIDSAPNSPSLSIINATASQNNLLYRAVVTSGNATAISRWAKLTTLPNIDITSHPSDQQAVSGSATFSASVSVPSNATTAYQWEYSTNVAPSSYISVSGATNPTLALNNLTPDYDDYNYRLKIVSSFTSTLQNIKYTNSAKLDFISPDFTIIQQPTNSYVADGSDAVFFVGAIFNEPSTDTIRYQWQESMDGINFTNLDLETNNSLIISSANKNQYSYRVIVSSITYSVFSNTVTINTGIELPDIANALDNTRMWGDPHLRLQSFKGTIGNIDDNCCNSPIVFFYVKFLDTNESYKCVIENKYSLGATRGPAVISNIYVTKNGIVQNPTVINGLKSLATPSSLLSLPVSGCTSMGLVGWEYNLGRIINCSTDINDLNLSNDNYCAILRNSIKWLSRYMQNPRILIISGGNSTNDNSLKTKLSTITLTSKITIGTIASSFTNANNILSSYDVVLLQHSNKLDMSQEGQSALLDFVKLGKGGLFITGTPTSLSTIGQYQTLKAGFAVESIYNLVSRRSPIRYINNALSSSLTENISNDFSFNSRANFLGTETLFYGAKPGAIVFYHSEQCIVGRTENVINIGNILEIRDNTVQGPVDTWGLYREPSIKWIGPINYSGNIEIGGALYWIMKCMIEHKKTPLASKYKIAARPVVGATIDGYGLMMQPFGKTRQMLSNAVNAADGSSELKLITETIDLSSPFWKNLSKMLAGLTPDDTSFSKETLYFVKRPNNRLSYTGLSVSMDGFGLSTSNNPVTYKWQVSTNNGTSYSNITNSTVYSISQKYEYTHPKTKQLIYSSVLTIKSPTLLMNEYKYRLVVEGSTGAVSPKFSNPATLTVAPSLKVTQFPIATKAESGSAMFITQASSSLGTAITYQWQTSTRPSSGFTNIAGATANILVVNINSIADITRLNNKYYRVIILDPSSSFTSNPVKLTAVPTITINSQPSNSIVDSKNNNTTSFGVGYTFTSPLSNPTVSYKWQKSSNNRTWSLISNSNSKELLLTNLTMAQNNTYYRVVITVDNISVTSSSAKLTIIPTLSCAGISITPRTKTGSRAGRAVQLIDINLTATPTATPGSTLTYTWQQSTDSGRTFTTVSAGRHNSINVTDILSSSYSNYQFRVLISNGTSTITVY